MKTKILYLLNRLKEQLWFRPFIFCLISIGVALVAQLADDSFLLDLVPEISKDSLNELLNTISSSMLVIAIFAVASMISAFSAASSTATPRSFKLVITDDVSQNALSIFIGSFIYSIVATVALKNGVYGKAGIFILFVITVLVFVLVIITFLRWVDRISRLGRLSHTIIQVEEAALKSISKFIKDPNLAANPQENYHELNGKACYSVVTGYIHAINIEYLQELAETENLNINVCSIPGKFVTFNSPLAYSNTFSKEINCKIATAFTIGKERAFDDDPRFGIITLSEIASRALSPGINDPGTAIQIIGSMVRLFSEWNKEDLNESREIKYDRISVPAVKISDLFIDAFRPIARDGAGNIEVMTRLQKALSCLSQINDSNIQKESKVQSEEAFRRAVIAMECSDDIEDLKRVFRSHPCS